MEEIADFPTGDWARAQEALRAYRRAVSELRDALNAGLPYLTPDLLMTDVD